MKTRKEDISWLSALLLWCLAVIAGCLWWQGMERKARDAEKPIQQLPARQRQKEPLKEPAKGFGKAGVSAAASAGRLVKARGKMAALPGGFVRLANAEGGTTFSVDGGGTMKVLLRTTASAPAAVWAYVTGRITLEQMLARPDCAPGNSATIAGVTITQYGDAGDPDTEYKEAHVVVAFCEGMPPVAVDARILSPGADAISVAVPVSWSFGPAFLGMKYTCNTPSSGGPAFSMKHGIADYRWFADEGTQVTVTGPGGTHATHPYTEITDLGNHIGGFSWGGSISSVGVDAAIISGLRLGGATIDTTGLDSALEAPDLYGCMKGFGGGECRLNTNYGPGSSGSAWAYPPVIVNFDLKLTKFGKHVWEGARLSDNWLSVPHYNGETLLQPYVEGGLPIPYQESHTLQIVPWAGQQGKVNGILALLNGFSIHHAWAAAQDPPPPENDYDVPIRCKLPGAPSGSDTYDAITLNLIPEIEVHRPDGGMRSSFACADGKIVVAESPSETVFTVIQSGGVVSRPLATRWRDYFDKSGPSWTWDTCRITKHVAGEEDVWSWSSHALLDVTLRSPVAMKLALTVEWTKPEVLDSYQLPAGERFDEWTWGEHQGTSTYTLDVAARPGEDQTARVNLLFPVEGGPAYLGRVDRVTISGLVPMPGGEAATVALKGMKLTSAKDADGNWLPYYIKLAPPPPAQRGKYSLVGISHDGASVTMEIPDQAYKNNEVLGYGGNLRYCEPLTSSAEGVGPLDWQVDIGTVAMWLNAIEGLGATYNEAASLAARSDGDAAIGPENADWLVPIYPVGVEALPVPGSPYALRACPVCRTLSITNGVPWSVKVDHALMAAIEVMTHNGENAPGDVGVEMQAYYLNSGGEKRVDPLARGVTDACGFAVVAPIPADGVRSWDVEQAA